MLKQLLQTHDVLLKVPEKIEDLRNPYLRQKHEVDLSSLAMPSDQGELLLTALL